MANAAFFADGRFDKCTYEGLLSAFREITIETMRHAEMLSVVKNHNLDRCDEYQEQNINTLINELKLMKVVWSEMASESDSGAAFLKKIR